MRKLMIPAVAMALSVSPVAFAQTQQGGGQQTDKPQTSAQQTTTRSYKDVENSLKQAGIQDVQVLNASYLVSAVTKQGEQVTFVVDPAATMGASGSSGGNQAGSSGQQQGGNQQATQQATLASQKQVRESLTKAGFQSVQILDATYLARGKTQNGDQITMMIDPSATTGEASSGGSSSQQSGGQKQ
jgi:hypothetical protein